MNKPFDLASSISRGDTLTDQAEAILRDSLMSGVFAPGQTITIRALSAMLKVSVTPAKDAMTRLIAERVLEWGPRRSALVPKLTLKGIDEIYTIRIALESAAAAAAVNNFNEKGIAELLKIEERLSQAFAKKNYKNVLAGNRDFHFAIYRRADLPMLLNIVEGQWLRMGPSLNLLYSTIIKQTGEGREGTGFHDEIIRAIEARDVEAVRSFMLADLTTGHNRLKASFASGVGDEPSAAMALAG